ncbi:MAG: AAA family ATPase [Acidobacteriota bacterium]
MARLQLSHVAQINSANLDFGHLTVLVGPQATGKSITLQFLKFLVDTGFVQDELERHGLDWGRALSPLLDVFFGEGMSSIWRDESTVAINGRSIDMVQLAARKRKSRPEKLFFIPAQRVIALRDGWPRPFTDYGSGDPFVVRDFSESLRVLVEHEFRTESLFPQKKRLKKEFRALLQRDVFADLSLRVDKFHSQKRLVLGWEPGSSHAAHTLPYMVWSAGQREFVPLLLGFYWLMPPTKVQRRGQIEWVVIEELEMGLHPRAISVVMMMVFELMSRGYRVCLSTHSPQVLEYVWAVKNLRDMGAAPGSLLRAFDAPKTQGLLKVERAVMNKDVRVYYFDPSRHTTTDISSLDTDVGSQSWGGLTEFSSRVNEAVAEAAAVKGEPGHR